ncbi:MAG: hypothetical protein AAFR17_07865 [Pseudomonadota bacterium]
MELKAAMHEIRKDTDKAKAFLDDPEGTLKSMGVDTSAARITKTTHAPVGSTHSVCGSGGCGVCVSAG